jgi:quinol monooxygenase YgiN
MIIVTGQARFGAGEIDRLRRGFTAWFEESRRRPGCISYHFAVDVADPDLLHVIEYWDDEASIDAHMTDMGMLMQTLAGAQMLSLKVDAYDARFVKTLMGE